MDRLSASLGKAEKAALSGGGSVMNTAAVETLHGLLQEAVGTVAIRARGQGSVISAGDYLSLIAADRRCYVPELADRSRGFEPVVSDSMQQALREVIEAALAEHIQGDMLQSAKIVTGGFREGFYVDDLIRHLFVIAVVRGPRYAATNFYECVNSESVGLQAITVIDGIDISNEIEISDGMRLVPMPPDLVDRAPYVSFSGFDRGSHSGRALIVVDQQVSPVFARPDLMSRDSHPLPFVRSNVDTKYPEFAAEPFCEALSLAINGNVGYLSWWTDYDVYQAWAAPSGSSSGYNPSRAHRQGNAVSVDETDVQAAMALYDARQALTPAVEKKLRIPISRWLRSKTDTNPVDIFANLGTALESLYVQDGRGTGEFRFKLALRGAWHLGSDAEERRSLKNDLAAVYDLRSQAVHTGTLSERDAASMPTARAQALCLRAITKVIEDGRFPDWDQLVVGAASTS